MRASRPAPGAARGAGRAASASSSSTKTVGRGSLEAAGTHERANEPRAALGIGIVAVERRRKVARVIVERSRGVQQPVGSLQQVVEVNRAFLAVLKLGQQDRVNTGWPRMAASIIALVLRPTAADA